MAAHSTHGRWRAEHESLGGGVDGTGVEQRAPGRRSRGEAGEPQKARVPGAVADGEGAGDRIYAIADEAREQPRSQRRAAGGSGGEAVADRDVARPDRADD